MPDATVLEFPEPDGNAGHIRDRVLDALECVQVAVRMLDTDTPDGDHAVRLHAAASDLSQVVFRLVQGTRAAALDAVIAEPGWSTVVDGQAWHVRQEPYGSPQLVKGPKPAPASGLAQRRSGD